MKRLKIGILVMTALLGCSAFDYLQYRENTGLMVVEKPDGYGSAMFGEVIAVSRAMRQLNEELFLILAKIIDARDPYVSGHSAKVADYATTIAMELGLPAERVEHLRQAALLHDIGKIGISEQVLHKPGKLTPEEYEYFQTHATLGAELLETCQGLRYLVPFVRHHHERWDGSGYPDGLRREQIPLEARILAVSDAVEAMASDRPHRRAMSLGEILAETRRCIGTQFDPAVAEAFLRVIEREEQRLVINSAREVAPDHADSEDLMHYINLEFVFQESAGGTCPAV